MRLKFILVMLFCLPFLTGTALAANPIVLNVDNENGAAVAMQNVVVSVSNNVATFSVSPKDDYPPGWFVTVALPEGVTVAPTGAVKDKNGNDIIRYTVDPRDTIGGGFVDSDGVKIIFSTATLPNPGKNQELYTTVYVTFSGTPKTSYFGAHVAWGEKINGIDSAKFSNGNTNIPEFSSIAVPVMAILGLLFISGRRRKE